MSAVRENRPGQRMPATPPGSTFPRRVRDLSPADLRRRNATAAVTGRFLGKIPLDCEGPRKQCRVIPPYQETSSSRRVSEVMVNTSPSIAKDTLCIFYSPRFLPVGFGLAAALLASS